MKEDMNKKKERNKKIRNEEIKGGKEKVKGRYWCVGLSLYSKLQF
jgi:hypothetical protein